MRWRTIATVVIVHGSLVVAISSSAATADPTTLKAAARDKVLIGSAVKASALTNATQPEYAEFVREQLSMVTTESELKWAATEAQQGQFTFGAADSIVDFAALNGLGVRGHTLVWHNSLPNWVRAYDVDGEANRQQLSAILEHHIKTVVGNYAGGRVDVWDVVNEPLADNGTRRPDSMWQRRLGDSYIADAFRWARVADPNAKLFLNEHSIELDTAKARALYELVKSLRAQGVPIDGVGFQAHRMLDASRLSALSNVLRQFADLGVEVAISEFDVRIPGVPATAEQLDRQADVFAAVVKACLSVPRCTSITTWGFTDRHSWLTNNPTYPGWGQATMLDASYVKKPAYHAMLSTLATTQRPSSANADLAGAWRLDDWSATTASDASGLDHPATVEGGALGAAGRTPSVSAFLGDGVTTGASTTAAVLATDASYTVSAWVRLDSKSADQVIVAQQGSAVSAFTIGYYLAADKWVFSIPSSDSIEAGLQMVESQSLAVLGQWTHLTAVVNTDWGHMSLYVDGEWSASFPPGPEPTGPVSFPLPRKLPRVWASAGVLDIGHSNSANRFHGAISDVRAHRRAVESHVPAIADPTVGRWELNGTLNDDSWFARDGGIRGDTPATWTAGQAGTPVGALSVTAMDYIDIRGRHVLYTDRSYTLSALVKLNGGGSSNQIILAQDGSGQHAFVLKYRASDRKWTFGLPISGSNSSQYSEIASTSTAQNTWVHLTAVWDGVTRVPRLYVNGNLEATGAATISWPSIVTGSLHLGTSPASKFDGVIDRVQVFQSALTPAEVSALAAL